MSEGSYDAALRAGLIVTGSPKTIIQKFKHIIDRTDPGYLTFWAREGQKAARRDDARHRIARRGSHPGSARASIGARYRQ